MKNIQSVVFDLYGTLYDVQSVSTACEEAFPNMGDTIATLWRQKQLEYTWLRSLMDRYVNFENATEDALNYACGYLGLKLDATLHRSLSDAYLRLQPHSDTPDALRRLHDAALPLGIISNGSTASISQVVENSGLGWAFDQLISVESVQVFKPHSKVYALAETRMGLPRENILFVSSNAWDATAAAHFGFPVCWVNRRNSVFDEMGAQPTYTVSHLEALTDMLLEQRDALHTA
ncbi:(S)-2-haloacid dehalogenase (2-haloalkanoic acid dehalogenase) (L-2-haloacid dehalogenase) (Halocarboxylic acid halidohydrolase) [Herminiimonas arsenicoxydans]|uniref:(S)-2-haloacid dehalogenase n=1 Tax=Herminiimonas arsenicoxydans TaxID=204773 RepID=A4G2X5_HERAR|nr:(S)-2-haloacid dehalogenase (2-haloalkanoic acid dehalogenase) (L-2-haloacid dehalogenase) (Halocarboxylic acid halidohydrolase) [Herminiimonas arsenicoxydans]